jgi:hypothetical protein
LGGPSIAAIDSLEPEVNEVPCTPSKVSLVSADSSPGIFDFELMEEQSARIALNPADDIDGVDASPRHPPQIFRYWDRIVGDRIKQFENWKVPDPDEDTDMEDEPEYEPTEGDRFIRAHMGPVCATAVMMNGWFGVMTWAMQNVWQEAVYENEMIDHVDIVELEPEEERAIDAVEPTATKTDRPILAASRKIGGRRYRLSRGVTVDSGAHDNVMPRRLLRGRRVRPSEASRAGVQYVACNNGKIPNEGEAELTFKSREGHEHTWTFQIAEVNKVLAAVSALVDSRHRVTFDQDEETGEDISTIVNKVTGVVTKMRRERNVWVVDAWVDEEEPGNDSSLFVRPE